MKLKIKTLAVTLLALLASACSNEDMVPAGSDHLTDAPVSITVGGIGTRAGYDKGYVIDDGSLGFWLDQSGTQYDADNLEVKCESGVWIPQGRLLWKNATDDVEYAASYPYDADGVYEVSLPDDQQNSDMLPFDILYAKGRVKGEDGAVNIVFSHALAQLKVKLTFGETLGTNPQIMSITLSNAALDGTFTVRDANGRCAWSNQGNIGKVTLVKNYHAEFECLLIPQAIEDYCITVEAVVGGVEKQYRFESTDLRLEQGATYTLPLQMGKEHPYVDLGLPSNLLWATYNVGATAPEEVGDYFAWGETEPKSDYSWDTYKYGGYSSLTKYCTNGIYGTIDNKTVLDISDDAATANWGSDWRMPTKKEMEELAVECTWSWTTDYNSTGVAGYIVSSKATGNTNAIFLPAASFRNAMDEPSSIGSYGYYWCSSLDAENNEPSRAWNFTIYSDSNNDIETNSRYYGLSVRAVRPQ